MIRARLEPQSVALVQGDADVPFGPPATERVLLAVRTRRAGHFVVLAIALINFDNRLAVGIVITPICSHKRGAGMNRRNPIELSQVRVKHLRVRCMIGTARVGARKARQWAYTTLGENHVS